MLAECEESKECETDCLGLATNPEDFVYGVPSDLNHNLTIVEDGDGNVLVDNEYGEDPSAADFDAVTEQVVGEREEGPIEFDYYDLQSGTGSSLVEQHVPTHTPACTSYLEEVVEEAEGLMMIPWGHDILTGERIPVPDAFPFPSPEPPPEFDIDELFPHRDLIEIWEVGTEQLFPRTFGLDQGIRNGALVTSTAALTLTPVFPSVSTTRDCFPLGLSWPSSRRSCLLDTLKRISGCSVRAVSGLVIARGSTARFSSREVRPRDWVTTATSIRSSVGQTRPRSLIERFSTQPSFKAVIPWATASQVRFLPDP